MTDEIKIWAVDSSSRAVDPIHPTDWKETEGSLEDVLVKNPDMLMQGLTLVGRQTPTESGYLDLLGVDEDGRLVLFELKRERIRRKAVTQAIEYCSYLESLAESELATHIAECSGNSGVDEIKDLEEWYGERFEGKDLSELRPTKIVLVGLGIDSVAQRMVGFLVDNGVDISLLTFHGYECGDRMLLARQVEGGEARDIESSPRQQRIARWRRGHVERAERLDMSDFWQEAVKELSVAKMERVTKLGVTFHMRSIGLDNVRHSGSHSIVIDEQNPMIRITFYPASIHLCWSEFQKNKEIIPFQFEEPRNARPTERVTQQWYCVLDRGGWEKHKAGLIGLAKSVCDTWEKNRRDAAA